MTALPEELQAEYARSIRHNRCGTIRMSTLIPVQRYTVAQLAEEMLDSGCVDSQSRVRCFQTDEEGDRGEIRG